MNWLGTRLCSPGPDSFGSQMPSAKQVLLPLILHEPHQANVLKRYQVHLVLEHLSMEGLI